jgi:hypothetical protein
VADRVTFVPSAAERIAAAVRGFEAGERDGSPLTFKRPLLSGGSAMLRLGKTTSAWSKGTTTTIDLYEGGTTGSETKTGTLVGAVNKFAAVSSGKWVMVGRGPLNGWYLIAAEC